MTSGQTQTATQYWKEHPPHRPDAAVHGLAIPFRRLLDGGRGDLLWFDETTELDYDHLVPLKLEHFGLLGHAEVTPDRDGLHIDGTVLGSRRKALADRHQLSPKLSRIRTTPRPDGVLQVVAATLDEVSLTRYPTWRGFTDAIVYQRPAG